jgi:hypothetical protein
LIFSAGSIELLSQLSLGCRLRLATLRLKHPA